MASHFDKHPYMGLGYCLEPSIGETGGKFRSTLRSSIVWSIKLENPEKEWMANSFLEFRLSSEYTSLAKNDDVLFVKWSAGLEPGLNIVITFR